MASPANTSSGDTRANKYASICATEAVRCMIFKHVGTKQDALKDKIIIQHYVGCRNTILWPRTPSCGRF